MSQNTITAILRYALFFLGGMGLVLTVGFFTQQDWAKMLIPWELDRLSCIFLSSICAASAVPILWIATMREYAAATGGAINFSLTFLGFAAFSFVIYASNPRQPVLLFGIFCALGFFVSIGLLIWSIRQPFRSTRPSPALVRFMFAFFAVALLLVGGSLVLKLPAIFPWTLTPQQSVLYGWIFLGASTYFGYGLARPLWGNAQGQLLGFLAYDIVLIVPFVLLFTGSEPFNLTSLVLYIAVLVVSAAVAIYYLFLNPSTRLASPTQNSRG